jgi:sugar phosphate isomerase/epimerase
MNRRTFISTSIAVSAASSLPAWGAEPTHHIDRVGLQLYTVRDQMKQDFDGTIAQVAQIGFREVEFAGYFGKSPKEARAILDKNGLTSPSTHVPYADIETKLPETIETAHIMGQKFVVCPWIDVAVRKQPDTWKRAAELFNKAGETTHKAGIQFAYHNHAFEFQPYDTLNGEMPYEFLLTKTDAALVKMELDLCWITVAGKDPIAYFNRYPGRFPLVHVKDWAAGTGASLYADAVGSPVKDGHIANVGSGTIDWQSIFAYSNKAGIKHYFVENDEAKSFDDPRASFEYLSKLKF